MASEMAGRPIRRIVICDGDHRAALIAHGLPEAVASIFDGLNRASRRGESSRIDPTLERLIGRPPASLRDVLGEERRPEADGGLTRAAGPAEGRRAAHGRRPDRKE